MNCIATETLFQYRLHLNQSFHFGESTLRGTSNWYLLSEGEIYLALSSGQLLEYSPKSKDFFNDNEQYCSYYLARFISDLGDIIPAIAISLPNSLKSYLTDFKSFKRLTDGIMQYFNVCGDQLPDENLVNWISGRALCLDYLIGGPNIWFFRMGDNVILHWNSDYLLEDNTPLWQMESGECVVRYDYLKFSLKAFGYTFFADMDKKIRSLHWLDNSAKTGLLTVNSIQQRRYDTQLEALESPESFNWKLVESLITQVRNLKLL